MYSRCLQWQVNLMGALTFYPSDRIGLEGYCRCLPGGRYLTPLPLSWAQFLSDRSQTW